jgi:hypothetical protein
MKTKKLFLGLALSLMTIGCNKDDEKSSTSSFTSDEAKVNSQIDVANDDVSDIVEGQFNAVMTPAGRSSEVASTSSNLPACANVTRTPEGPLADGTAVTINIDFGDTDCEMPNGNILKGEIIITFTYHPTASTNTINYEFVDFYHNAIKFTGNKSFTRTMSGGETSHPIVVMTMDMNATFPDGRVLHRVGTRTREIIEGYGTPLIFADNVYQVTGNWTTTFPNTTVQTSTITTPLKVKMSCANLHKPLLVEGVITFTRNGNIATLDYGNGDCDNIAIFTINGNSYTINIGGN